MKNKLQDHYNTEAPQISDRDWERYVEARDTMLANAVGDEFGKAQAWSIARKKCWDILENGYCYYTLEDRYEESCERSGRDYSSL